MSDTQNAIGLGAAGNSKFWIPKTSFADNFPFDDIHNRQILVKLSKGKFTEAGQEDIYIGYVVRKDKQKYLVHLEYGLNTSRRHQRSFPQPENPLRPSKRNLTEELSLLRHKVIGAIDNLLLFRRMASVDISGNPVPVLVKHKIMWIVTVDKDNQHDLHYRDAENTSVEMLGHKASTDDLVNIYNAVFQELQEDTE